jgi:all-trans-8'-apo-beta-carotenal 15,15'-oxygenase
VPKDALDAPRWFEAEFAAIYHFADAFERGGVVTVRAQRHSDAESARSPMAATLRGEPEPDANRTELVNLHLDLASGRARWEATGIERVEFATFDPRTRPGRGALLYAPTTVGPAEAPYFNGVARIDAERGQVQRHSYGPRICAEEHRFVPRPGGHRAEDGWLLGTLLDWEHGRSGIAVLDARRVSDGPIATAWVPYTLPLGFHGFWS